MSLRADIGIQCLPPTCCRPTGHLAHLRHNSPACSLAAAGTRQEVNRTVELVAAMKKVLLIVFSISLLTLACKSTKEAASTRTRSRTVLLFDGKTFKGWVGDTSKTFRIEDGAIVGGTM